MQVMVTCGHPQILVIFGEGVSPKVTTVIRSHSSLMLRPLCQDHVVIVLTIRVVEVTLRIVTVVKYCYQESVL